MSKKWLVRILYEASYGRGSVFAQEIQDRFFFTSDVWNSRPWAVIQFPKIAEHALRVSRVKDEVDE